MSPIDILLSNLLINSQPLLTLLGVSGAATAAQLAALFAVVLSSLVVTAIAVFVLYKTILFFQHALGWGVGKLALPAQFLASKGTEIKGEFFVTTLSGNSLSTKKIEPHSIDNSLSKSDDYIIAFCPNAVSYRQVNYTWLVVETHANVIAFDYPNVGNSTTGWVYSQDPLIEAGIAQVQNLLDQGIPGDRITLYGHSLGGAVGTMVAAHFHNQEPPQRVSVINDRSFSRLGDTVAGICRISALKYIFNPICYLLNWDMNAASAYRSLPKENKMLIFSKNDHVIHAKIASVYSAMRSDFKRDYKYYESKDAYKVFKKTCALDSDYDHHCDPLVILKDQTDAKTPMIQHINKFIKQ